VPNIVHELVVRAPREQVFRAMVTPDGLAQWWTKASDGKPQLGAEYRLFFGPDFDWRGTVTRYEPDSVFELAITKADPDWIDTRVRCELQTEGAADTRVRFFHTGWPAENAHWRISAIAGRCT
jgi:uncharacterized protein YndB with AHSA1/START domain